MVSKTNVSRSNRGGPAKFMASLEIKKLNDPILRKKASLVDNVDSKIKTLISDLAQTMKENEGIGLAAPQIGISKQVVVVLADEESQDVLALINPHILKKSKEKNIMEEGCLSFPGIYLDIKRSNTIEVEALNLDGKKVKFEAKGLLARIIQHETDHIKGILFFNRLGFVEKVKFKLKNLSIKL